MKQVWLLFSFGIIFLPSYVLFVMALKRLAHDRSAGTGKPTPSKRPYRRAEPRANNGATSNLRKAEIKER